MKEHTLNNKGYDSVQEFQKGLEDFIDEDKNKWELYASSSRYQEKSLSFSGSLFRVTNDLHGHEFSIVYQGDDINEACKVYLEL